MISPQSTIGESDGGGCEYFCKPAAGVQHLRAAHPGIVGIALAAVSAAANFLFIPRYPVWALIIIAFDAAVIWALSTDRGRLA
jgi:hypothetical protein